MENKQTVWVYPETTSVFVGNQFTAEANGYIEVAQEDYDSLVARRMKWADGQLVETTAEERAEHEAEQAAREARWTEQKEKSNVQNEIDELKRLLNETDYKAIKYAEGWITEDEYAETKAIRQSYRDRINELLTQ